MSRIDPVGEVDDMQSDSRSESTVPPTKPIELIYARLSRLTDAPLVLNTEPDSIQGRVFEDFVFIFDPFQACTPAVFESIYRYGRGFFS